MKLHEIREARATKVAEARALLDTAQGKLNADQQKAFDGLKSEITDLEGQEQRASFIEEAERRAMGQPADKQAADLEKRISVIDAINAQVEGRSLSGALAEFNKEQKRMGIASRGVLVPASLFEKRATTTTAAQIVPDDFAPNEYVGLLRNSMVVQRLGARVLPNLRGDLVVPKAATAHTAEWLAEGDKLTGSNATYDSIKLTPRHVGAKTELSRQLLQQSSPAVEALVRDDFVQIVSLAVDKAMLHGDGIKEPLGLIGRTGLAGDVQTGNLATLSWATFLELFEALALVNANPNGIVTHAEVVTKLRSTLKTASLPGYLMENGQVGGITVSMTNQIEAKAGTPNKGRLLMGDFGQVLIGQWGALDVLANPYAQDSFDAGAVQIRVMATMDAQVRHEAAFVVVEDIGL